MSGKAKITLRELFGSMTPHIAEHYNFDGDYTPENIVKKVVALCKHHTEHKEMLKDAERRNTPGGILTDLWLVKDVLDNCYDPLRAVKLRLDGLVERLKPIYPEATEEALKQLKDDLHEERVLRVRAEKALAALRGEVDDG